MKNKKGISLITLVITIVVLGILAAAVIISLSNTNVIEQASESTFKDDVSKIKEQIEMEKINKLLNASYSFEGIIPEKYENILKVTSDGCLTYIGDETTSQKEWSADLGIKIIESASVSHFNKLREIENLAIAYYNEGNKSVTTNVLTTQYIRRNRYTGTTWTAFAGSINTTFSTYLENNKTIDLFGDNDTFKDPVTGTKIDFVHQIATMNAYFYGEPKIVDAYAGWAGDLCTVLKQVQEYKNAGSYTNNELLVYAKSLIGSTGSGSTMDISDALADIDAANISRLVTDDSSLSDTMYSYYYGNGQDTCNNRYALFKTYLEEIAADSTVYKVSGKSLVYSVALAFLGGEDSDSAFSGIYANNIVGNSIYRPITDVTKSIVAQAFDEYIAENI